MKSKLVLYEKYKPCNFDHYISCKAIRPIIDSVMEDPYNLQHMILVGRAGLGKSSFVSAYEGQFKAVVFKKNTSKDTSVEITRSKEYLEFLKSGSLNGNVPKVVVFEEANRMSSNFQDALKEDIGEYSGSVRYIFTTNSITEIIEPIQSRCKKVYFGEPDRKEIYSYLNYIIESEGFEFDSEHVLSIIQRYYPDIRSMVNAIESISLTGDESLLYTIEYSTDFYNALKGKSSEDALAVSLRRDIDFKELNTNLYRFIADDSEISIDDKLDLFKIIGEIDIRMRYGLPEIGFNSQMSSLCKKFEEM